MAFTWYESTVPVDVASDATRLLKMHRQEIEARAALLMRLGWDEATVVDRCRRALEWEFELAAEKPLLRDVEVLVRAVFSRRGVPPSPLEAPAER